MSIFYLGNNLDLTVGKYFIKIISDNKIEISIFQISIRPNLNKLWVLLILGPILG